jgi:hypothetical protein
MGVFTDDPSFWPILEVFSATGKFLLIQTGNFAGTDISFNNPPAPDRMLQSFLKVNVVLAVPLIRWLGDLPQLRARKHTTPERPHCEGPPSGNISEACLVYHGKYLPGAHRTPRLLEGPVREGEI